MAGDYSRKTFDRKKHYSGVLMQQGRVQLDSDFNEQLGIQLYRTETESIDVVGQSGVPKDNDGFRIINASGGHDLAISAGRVYVDGLLCELDQPATYIHQPHLPNPDFTAPALTSPPSSPPGGPLQLSLPDGTYLVFLDAWQREITALDDKLIREVALGGPDTTTRIQNVFQIKLQPVQQSSPPASPPGELTCETATLNQPASTGTLNARTQPPPDEENVCLLPPSAGYTRLENQLYRVEIHTGGSRNQATFKWSRDNASVETKIENIDGANVTVSDLGKDEVLGFAGGQWVEIVDDESTLKATPHPLAQIDKIDPASRKITLKTSVGALANRPGLKLRRWDQSGTDAKNDGVNAALANWIDLEGGIQVQLSAGQYNSGDYWLIPARTATGEIEWPPFQIPNTSPIAQPPRGIKHHYCKLALVEIKGGLAEVKEDCREKFPPLTHICAEDVCFDNTNCQLGQADTVQEAIDLLCAERDLRFHNKHLHGWGIVCGLQVECGPDSGGQQRRHVTVRKGYAIDCEGNDIILKGDDQIDLIDLIQDSLTFPPASPPTSPPGLPDTDVCLVLDSNPQTKSRYRVEKVPPNKNSLQSLLKGTLLMDFFTECLKSLTDFVTEQFTTQAGEAKTPVGPTQKRITTFSNLLIQLTNKQNGAFVFLSGDKGKSDKNFEDTILRDFYTKLREKLQSHTFCAMFENARPFPDYPYQGLGIRTIFSKGFQNRVRISPGGAFAYSVGATNKINVFDLKTNEMIDELEFPGSSNSIVRDVAFSKDGRQLFAVATVDNKDSFFAVADVSGSKHSFRKPTMVCDILLLSLGTSASTSENVFAVGKSKGLYSINPQNVDPKPQPMYAFNAVGQLAIDDTGKVAFATASSQAAATDTYNQVLRLNLGAKDPSPPVAPLAFNTLQLTGEDDIAVATGQLRKLFVVVNPPPGQTDKHVLVFLQDKFPTASTLTNLRQDTAIRLAHNPVTDHLMVTYEDSYRVGMLDSKDALVPDFVPVQVSPLSIAVAPDQKRTYVLNYASNTISMVPTELFATGRQIPLQPLVDYRAAVLNAFADLLGGLLQYLKDCLCDHLLVDCPECEPDDKIYLACISIKNGQVFKVCNFSLRKYVHTFPTVEYWLSIVPVIPMIKAAIEKFCCAALPGLFAKFNASTPPPPSNDAGAAKNTLKGAQIRKGVTFAQQSDFRAALSDVSSRVRTGKPVFKDFAVNTANKALVKQPLTATHTEVAGQPIADARKQLEAAGVVVEKVEAYDPARGARNIADFTTAPVRLEAGTRIKLVTKDDKVLFYTRADAPPPAIDDLRTQFESTRKLVDDNNAAVTANKAEVEKILPQLRDLNAKVDSATTSASQIDDLRSKVAANTTDLQTNKASIADALRMRDEITSLKDELAKTRQTHTDELASRDREIAALKSNAREFQTTIDRVKDLQTQFEKLRPRPPVGVVVRKKKKEPKE